jgi:hypothetical protein
MALTLTFNQEFLPPGGTDQGRTDIYSDIGAAGRAHAVQIGVAGIPDGSTIELVLLDEPPGASPLLTQLSQELWTLDFLLGCWGPFRIRCNAVVGGVVVDSVTRRISIRSPGYALQYPALAERTDPNAQLVATVPSIDLTEMNEGATNRPLVDFHREVCETLESIGAGSITTIPDGAIGEAKLDPAFVASIVFRDGSHSMQGALDLSGHKIVDLAQPTAPTDAARLADVTAASVIAGDGLAQSGPTVNVVANADGSIIANPDDVQIGTLATDAQHGTRGGGTQHAVATPTSAGFHSVPDKLKLDGIQPGADPTIATLAAATAAISVNGQRITSLGAPTANSDATNKTYVDNRPPVSHSSSHADGGTDELNVTGLTGVLADPQVAGSLKTATGAVVVSASAAPSVGQVPTATGATAATWQTPTQLASTAPTQVSVTTAAQGAGTTSARADHVHSVLANVTPSSLPVGGTAALGTSTALARADHVHDLPAGTPIALTIGGSNAGGSSTSVARADHTHALVGYGSTGGTITQGNDARLSDDRTASGIRTTTSIVVASGAAAPSAGQVPTATGPTALTWQTPLQLASAAPSTVSDVAAAVGVATAAARTDHVHAVSTGAPVALAIGSVQATGTASSLAKSDHVHAMPAAGTPSSLTLAGANAAGVATTFARSDHTHALPATAAPANLTVGAANSAGASTSLVRADHVHGMPGLASGAADGFQAAADFTKLAGIEAGAQVTSFARVQTALGLASSAVGFNAQRLTGVADPSSPQDVATKAYTDALAQGLDMKASCRLVSTNNMGTLGGAQVIDGIVTSNGDRVLIAGQTTASANGIYVCSGVTWLRAPDADSSAKVTSGMYVFVTEGNVNSDSGWALITPDPIVLGTTALTFSQVTGAAQITAGTGLAKSGNTLNVGANADGSIIANADDVQVGVLATDAQHGTRGGGSLHPAAVAGGASGFITGADQTKLNGIATGAAAVLSVTPLQVDATSGNGGAAVTASRSDHRHQVTAGSPVALTLAGATADGTSSSLARADHVHALPATAAPAALTVGAASSAGVAVTINRSDHVHAMPAAGTPVALTLAGANAAGSAATIALSDHVHALPASSTAPPALTVGGSSAAGSSTSLSKADHVHALPASSAPLENTGVATAGTSTSVARDDHRHPTAWKAICTALLESVGFNASAPPTTVDGVTIVAGNLILVDGTLAPLAADDSEPEPLAGELLGIFVSLGATWQFLETLDRGEVAYVLSRNTLYTYSGSQYVELYPEVNYSQHGLMSVFDYTKLVSIQANAAAVTSTAPTQITVTTAAAGSSGSAARGDHVHSVSTGSPVALGIGQTAGDGTSTALARADHSHATPSSGIPVSLTLAATNAAGVATTVSRSDHVHALPSSSVIPSALTMGTAGSAGSSLGISKADHTHPLPNAGTPTNLTLAGTNFAGSAATLAVSDHVHALPATAAPVALTPGGSNAAGSAVTLPRSDHVHALPAFGQTSGTFCDGADARLTVIPAINGFRLAPNVDDSPPADGSFTTVYLAPVTSDLIALYTASVWTLRQASGVSYVLSGRTTDLPFDVFAFWSGTAVALEVLNWTSGTARATGLTRQNGVWTKTGDATRRYLGTVRPRSATAYHIYTNGSDTQPARCDLWNTDNQYRLLFHYERSWTPETFTHPTANTWVGFNGTSSRFEFVQGIAGNFLRSEVITGVQTKTFTAIASSNLDSVSSPSGARPQIKSTNTSDIEAAVGSANLRPGIGVHFVSWNIWADNVAVVWWAAQATHTSGLQVEFNC